MEEIIRYLKTNVMGRPMQTDELVYSLEDGAIEGVYSDQMTFSNLKYSESGMTFDLFVIANEKLYKTDENKNRIEQIKDYSGVSLFRYELAKRRNSNELTGFMRFVSASWEAVPAEAVVNSVFDFKYDAGKNELTWKEEQVLYRDNPNSDGTDRPVAFDSTSRFYSEGGKLRYQYDGVCKDFNLKTHEKTISKDVIPQFLSKEK